MNIRIFENIKVSIKLMQIIVLFIVYNFFQYDFIKRIIISTLCRSNIFIVKLFQWLSANPNIKNVVFTNVLPELREKCDQHSIDITREIVRNNFGKEMEDVFESIDILPIASASIAQVYKGIYDGTEVAIKVRHPNLDKDMLAYNRVLRYIIFKLSPGIKKLLDFDNFYMDYYEQINLEYEAENAKIFHEIFESNDHIIIPKVLYASKDLLIYEYIKSVGYPNIKLETTKDYIDVLSLLKIFQLESIAQKGIYHGDMHFSNWGMSGDKLVVYDYGFVKKIDIETVVRWNIGVECDCKYYVLKLLYGNTNMSIIQNMDIGKVNCALSDIKKYSILGNEEKFIKIIIDLAKQLNVSLQNDVINLLQYELYAAVLYSAHNLNSVTPICFIDILPRCIEIAPDPEPYLELQHYYENSKFINEKIKEIYEKITTEYSDDINELSVNIIALCFNNGVSLTQIINVIKALKKNIKNTTTFQKIKNFVSKYNGSIAQNIYIMNSIHQHLEQKYKDSNFENIVKDFFDNLDSGLNPDSNHAIE